MYIPDENKLVFFVCLFVFLFFICEQSIHMEIQSMGKGIAIYVLLCEREKGSNVWSKTDEGGSCSYSNRLSPALKKPN